MLGSQAAVDLSQDPTASAVGSAGAAEVDPDNGPSTPDSRGSRRGSVAVSAMLKQGKAEGEEIDLF